MNLVLIRLGVSVGHYRRRATFVLLHASKHINQSSAEPKMAVRACIFDVDGTLINSEDVYTDIYNNILREYGRPDYPWAIKATQQSRGSIVRCMNVFITSAKSLAVGNQTSPHLGASAPHTFGVVRKREGKHTSLQEQQNTSWS